MKCFRMIRRMICLTAALLLFVSSCPAEGTLSVEDAGLDLTEQLSVHYPALSGPDDEELLKQINGLIQDTCRIGEYLGRAAMLLSGGSLKVEWKGGLLGDVFSCAVSAVGAVENTRTTHVWTACTVDLRDGRRISMAELFTDTEEAMERIGSYLEETVMPELSPYLQNSELTPLPETFFAESTGLTLLYPVGQLCTLSDRAGDVRISWHVLEDVLDLGEDSVPVRMGVPEMITLSPDSAERIRNMAEEGSLTGIPAKIGDSMKELTDRYHLLNDPDGYEGGRLFSLESGCFGGTFLMTDDLTRSWENSRVEGIRADRGCLWGLCIGETLREEWLSVLGEPDGSSEVDGDRAEAYRICTGICDRYRCGGYQLQLYSDETGMLFSIILTE